MKFRNILITVMSLFFTNVYASVNSDLHNFFESLGFSDITIEDPSVYHGQEAGYYTGGKIIARSTVRDYKIAQIDIPSYRSGCGSIDLFAGGFSFINSDQLIAMVKNIMSNAKGYAFTLALESVTPEIANVMHKMQDIANKINQMNINSCETAAGLVGSLWPKTQTSQRRVCEDIGSRQGIFADYAAAHQGCGAEGQLTSTLNNAQGAYKNVVLKEGNIAWKAIQQNDFLRRDQELAELFLSLSGSIIIKQNGSGDDATNQFILLQSLVDQQLLRAVLHGGTAKIYRCVDENCLNTQLVQVIINQDSSLSGQVRKILDNIARKIYADETLSKDEIGLLQVTQLPIYQIINVQAAFYRDSNLLDVANYSEIIALDILFQYLNENLDIIKESGGNLQYPEDVMKKFMDGLDKVRETVIAEQKMVYAQIVANIQMIEQSQLLEKLLTGHLSQSLSQTLLWAKGIH